MRYVRGTTHFGMRILASSAKKQSTVTGSNAEAEYYSMASIAAEITWLSFLLRNLGIPLSRPPILHCDNLSALHMTINPVFHGRTKHIELDHHFVREKVALDSLETRFVSSISQLADIFTKLLPKASFLHLRTKLGLCPNPRPSLKGSDNTTHSNE